MSGITNENWTEMLTSCDGDVIYDLDDIHFDDYDAEVDSSEDDSLKQQEPRAARTDHSPYDQPTLHTTPISEVDEDMMYWKSSSLRVSDEASYRSSGNSSEILNINSNGSPYTSFPCLISQELRAAAETPLKQPHNANINQNSGYKYEDYIQEPPSPSTTFEDMQISVDDQLAAATDGMAIDPPFWPSSSSDSDSDSEEISFANDGWGEDHTRDHQTGEVSFPIRLKRRGAIDYGRQVS
jgi:hypothetical protein